MNARGAEFADMWTYRIKYEKTGTLRFISHLDVMRALIRALRRANIPIAYSRGFNPRPKISMGPPLPLGYESRCEFAEFSLLRPLAPETIRQRLKSALPQGLTLLEIDWASSFPNALSDASAARYMIELRGIEHVDTLTARIRDFLSRDAVWVERVRKNKHKRINIRPYIKHLEVVNESSSDWMFAEILMGSGGSCSAAEAVQAVLDLPPETAKCLRIIRTDLRFAIGM
jgi:radical SAM-linked protein